MHVGHKLDATCTNVIKSVLYLRVTIVNNFVTARRTSAKFCKQTRVVYTWPEHGIGEMSLRCRTFQKISRFLNFAATPLKPQQSCDVNRRRHHAAAHIGTPIM